MRHHVKLDCRCSGRTCAMYPSDSLTFIDDRSEKRFNIKSSLLVCSFVRSFPLLLARQTTHIELLSERENVGVKHYQGLESIKIGTTKRTRE